VSANSYVKVSLLKNRLNLQLFSAESSCLVQSAGVSWNSQTPEQSVAEAVEKLLKRVSVFKPLSKPLKSPPSQMAPVWRSMVVPGWGQFYNGQETKGLAFSIGQAILVPIAIGAHLYSENAAAQARETNISSARDIYADRSQRGHHIAVAAGIAAAALYIYNIVDAGLWSGYNVDTDNHSKTQPYPDVVTFRF
jgi:hypothetical protein